MIRITKPTIHPKTITEVKRVLKSGWLTQGPMVKQFEKSFSGYVHALYAVAVNSCTAALHLCLEALSIRRGDEVLVPSFTFVATANAVEYTGAQPVFVDIDLNTFNINPGLIEQKISKHTKAIIPVHLFGNPVSMKEIMRIARKYNLAVIEDAACAVGSKYYGKHAGTFGKAGCFSFHPRKIITTGEGGMITTQDKRFAATCMSLRSHGHKVSDYERFLSGTSRLPDYPYRGYNYRMSDINAAVGLYQMKHLNAFIEKRVKKALIYLDELRSVSDIKLPEHEKESFHTFQSFVILLQSYSTKKRNIFAQYLYKKGIAASPGTHSVPHLSYYKKKYGFDHHAYPNGLQAEHFSFTLPLFPDLSHAQQKYIIKTIKNYFKG